jgi:mannitol-1-phosphate/altronate dehydrogenase
MSSSSTKTIHALAPAYRQLRASAPPSHVHLGVGNFFRSHLNFLTHCALAQEEAAATATTATNWTIHGIGSTTSPAEHQLHASLQDQAGLYSLLSLPSATADVVGALSSLSHTRTSSSGLHDSLDFLSSPNTKIISMTVTEKGYHQDNATGALDFTAPDVVQDVSTLSHHLAHGTPLDAPLNTTVGLLVAALGLRKQLSSPSEPRPVTLLCCDNLPHNGRVLQNLVLEMCDALDPALATWVRDEANVTFPNSMVGGSVSSVVFATVHCCLC